MEMEISEVFHHVSLWNRANKWESCSALHLQSIIWHVWYKDQSTESKESTRETRRNQWGKLLFKKKAQPWTKLVSCSCLRCKERLPGPVFTWFRMTMDDRYPKLGSWQVGTKAKREVSSNHFQKPRRCWLRTASLYHFWLLPLLYNQD